MNEHTSGDALVLGNMFSSAGSLLGSLGAGSCKLSDVGRGHPWFPAMTRAVSEQPSCCVFYPQVRQDAAGGSSCLHLQAYFSELFQASPVELPETDVPQDTMVSSLCPTGSEQHPPPQEKAARCVGGAWSLPRVGGAWSLPGRRGRWPGELRTLLGEQELWLVTKLHVTSPSGLVTGGFTAIPVHVGGWVGSYRNPYRLKKKILLRFWKPMGEDVTFW